MGYHWLSYFFRVLKSKKQMKCRTDLQFYSLLAYIFIPIWVHVYYQSVDFGMKFV